VTAERLRATAVQLWQSRGMRTATLVVLAAALGAGCASAPTPRAPPPPIKPPAERADAPVVRRALPEAAVPAPAGSAEPASATIVVPADAIYVCVIDRDGSRTQTVIELAPKVHDLCRRHPEMGPCQYERNTCRAAGGRVYAAGGREITLATEEEYDRKVLRVRFRSN
jgi:hypothetical protein